MMATIPELHAEIAHLRTLLVTQTDEQARSAMLDFIRELERRISHAETAAAARSGDGKDASRQSPG
jgi:hypothetical protein